MATFTLWYLVSTIIGWLALPLAYGLFSRLPDRGYTFSKPLGILVGAYIFWLLGSAGFLANNQGGILFALLVTAIAGVIWQLKQGLKEMPTWLSEHKKYLLAVELFFLLAFTGMALVRAYLPDINGTEKPMEFMFINSILRSPTLPPHDAWLSGHAISYYYFGYLMVAMLARLTGTQPGIAFNLGLALVLALSAVAALGVSVNLVALAQRGLAVARRNLQGAFWPGLLGPLLVILVGNFYGALEVAHDNGWLAGLELPVVWYDFGRVPEQSPVQSLDDFAEKPGVRVGTIDFWQWLDLKRLSQAPQPPPVGFSLELDNWFFAARVIHDRSLTGVETEAIDENPAFSFLLGDLHPHVLALPFVMLTIGLAVQWLIWGRESGQDYLAQDRVNLPLASVLGSSVVLGALAFLNTWDFPIYWFLTLLAAGMGFCTRAGWRALARCWRSFVSLGIGLQVLSVASYIPFYLTFQSQAGGLLPNLIYPSRFQQVVVMFGPLLAGVVLFLLWLATGWKGLVDRRAAWIAGLGLVAGVAAFLSAAVIIIYSSPILQAEVRRYIEPLTVSQALSLLFQRRLVDSLAILAPAAIVGVVFGWLAGVIRRNEALVRERVTAGDAVLKIDTSSARAVGGGPLEPDNPAVVMVVLLTLTGSLLLLLPEFVYLRDNFGTRMNTLFKFYYQVWVLWGFAAAAAIWLILHTGQRWLKALALVLMGLCIGLGLTYTAGALAVRAASFRTAPTLDGMAYFKNSYPDDAAAIEWLRMNADSGRTGETVLLEGTRGAYWVEGRSSRLSMATGIPTVLGWANHEAQWRGPYFSRVAGREADIRVVYQTRDWQAAEAVLERYGVEYVIVSPLESDWYGRVYTPKFDQHMQRVFQSGDLVIYQRRP